MKKLFGLLLLFNTVAVFSQTDYSIVNIADSLIKTANVVTRVSSEQLEIKSAGRASYSYLVAHTILNEEGAQYAMQHEFYDKFREIKSIDVDLYDALGKKIKSLKSGDIQDLSGNDNAPGITDNRYKQFGFYHRVYPYTVEFKVSVQLNGLMFLPNWYAVAGANQAVQKSSFEVSFPDGIDVKYKSYNYAGSPVQKKEDGKTKLRWEVSGLTAQRKELNAPPWYELTPSVFLALQQFEIEKYQGSNASWQSLGDFIFTLNKGKDQLPPVLKQKVASIISGKASTREKVDALYKYMQENTHYVSIQLGIGGWQPLDAGFVYDKKYGDCKALTNYMYALLKEAGIQSVYSLIKAGRGVNRFMDDFPSSQFNHVILCVPDGKDSIWLECTSQTMPAGYLGDFTCDRPALMVLENGSKLVRTPRYTIDQNLQRRQIAARLDAEGNLVVKASTSYRAMQQDFPHALIHQYSKDKQLEYLKSDLDIAHYDIKEFAFKESMADLPWIDESLEIEAPNYAQITGKRCFITPNILSKTNNRPSQLTERKYDLVYSYAYRDIDSAVIDLPEGYIAESIPKPAIAESVFGKYQSQVVLNGNKLLYVREMQHYGGRFAPSNYSDLVKFYETIYKADRAKVVLVKKE